MCYYINKILIERGKIMPDAISSIVISAAIQASFNAVFGTIASVMVRPLQQKLESTGFFNLDAKDVIGQYGEDLVEKAKQEHWTGVAGREEKIADLIRLLRQRRNPCITGEAGVGKTALVEGLAALIARGEVPDDVKDWKIIKVDFPSLIVGKGYGGDPNSGIIRLRALFEYAIAHPNVVIFIDEVHQFSSYAELCKTYLDRHQLMLIGATTNREFEKYMASKDEALERRFTKILLEAPDSEIAFKIIKDRVPYLEKKYNIRISDEILAKNVALIRRYIPYKSSPDKEIKNLEIAAEIAHEESLAAAKQAELENSNANETSTEIAAEAESCNNTEEKTDKPNNEEKKENSSSKSSSKKKASLWTRFKNLFKKKSKTSSEKPNTSKSDSQEKSSRPKPPVDLTEQHLRQAIKASTRIPVTIPTLEESNSLFTMAAEFKKHLFGQDENIDRVCKTLIRARFEANDSDQIRGAFLFAGPSGTGKSYFTTLLSTVITPSYVLDASQFKDELRTQVIRTVNSSPYCMLVFEGIDAAPAEIRREISGIIDRGYALDYDTGYKVSFKNTIIVSTVNTGAVDGNDDEEMAECLLDKLGYENASKLGELLIFKSLDEAKAKEFVTSTLDAICFMISARSGVELTYENSVVQALVKMATDTSKGLRLVMNNIKDVMYDINEAVSSLSADEIKTKKVVLTLSGRILDVKIEDKQAD